MSDSINRKTVSERKKTGPPVSGYMPFLRYMLFFMGVLSGLLFVAALSVVFFINSEKGRSFIVDTVNSNLLGEAGIGGISFNPLEGSLELKDINLAGPEKSPVAGIGVIKAEIDWSRLFKGEIYVSEIKISDPRIYIFETVGGQLNISGLFKPSADSGSSSEGRMLPFNVIVKNAVISDAVFVYADRSIKSSVAGLHVEADYNLALNSGSLEIKIPAAELDVPGFRTGFESTGLEAVLENGNIERIFLGTVTRFGILELAGRISDVFTEPFFELNLNTLAGLEGIGKACGLDSEMNGMASGNLKVSGTIGDPEASLQVICSSGRFGKTSVNQTEITSYIKNRQAVINVRASEKKGQLSADSYVNLASAFPYSFFPENPEDIDIEKMDYGIDLKFRNMDLKNISGSAEPEAGTISGSIKSGFRGVTPSEMSADIKTDISGRNIVWKSSARSPVLELDADIGVLKGSIDVRKFNLEAADSKIVSKAEFLTPSGSFSGSLKIDSPDISKLGELSGIIKTTGSLKGEAVFSGTFEKPSFRAKIAAENLGVEGYRFGSIKLDSSLEDSGKLEISELRLKNRSSELRASGHAVIPLKDSEKAADMPVNLELSLKNFDPSFFTEQPLPFSGIFDAELEAWGKASDPGAELKAEGKNISVSGTGIGNAVLDARLSKGRLKISNLSVTNRSSLLSLVADIGLFTGRWPELESDPEIKAEITKAELDIRDFVPSGEGRVTASGNIAGTIGSPSGRFEITAGEMTFDKTGILSAGLKASLKNKRIDIESLEISPARNESILATGWVGTNGEFAFNLDSKGISLSNFRDAVPLKKLSGSISASVKGRGRLDNPEIDGSVMFSGIGANGQTLGDFRLDLDLREKIFRAESVSGSASASGPVYGLPSGTGVLNLYADLKKKNFSADMNLRELDLSPFFRSAGIEDLEGKTDAGISAKGSFSKSDQISARAEIKNFGLEYRKNGLLSCRSFSASFERDVLSVLKSDIKIMKKGNLSVSGKLDLKKGHDFSIKSSIALDDAAPLAPDMVPDIEGTITADARITGAVSKPVMQGEVGIKNVALTVPGTFQRLHGLNGRIIMVPGRITLERTRGMLDDGTVGLGGNIIMDGLEASDIRLGMTARNLPVRVPDAAEMVCNANISLTGSGENPLLSGEAVIVEGIYYKDADLSLVSLPKRPVRKKPPFWESIENPFLKNMGLDISLKKREPLVVDNNLAKLELSPDLRLTGKVSSPVLSGRCKVDSGTIHYRKNEYEVKKGVIDFINPYRIEPEFDIESSAKIRKWTVTLKISGTPEKLEFDLSSNPALDDNDILSLVILGNVTKNVSASQAAKRPATEMLGEMLASTFSDEIKSVAGLDILEAGDNQSEDEDLTRVTIGKNLSRRLAVKYSVDSKAGEISQKAIAEYRLLENIILNGFRNSNGIYGGELQYRLEFR